MKYKTYTLSELVQIKYGKSQKKVLSDKGIVPIYGTGGLAAGIACNVFAAACGALL